MTYAGTAITFLLYYFDIEAFKLLYQLYVPSGRASPIGCCLFLIHYTLRAGHYINPSKDEAQTALSIPPVRTTL